MSIVIGVAAGNENFAQAIKDQFSNENEGAAKLVKQVIRKAIDDMKKEAGTDSVELIDVKVNYAGSGVLEGKSILAVAIGKVNV